MTQLDRIEKKVDELTALVAALMEMLVAEDEGGADGERDQTQPL